MRNRPKGDRLPRGGPPGRGKPSQFKARVALKALQGVKTVQVTQWKSQVAEEAASLFEKGSRRGGQEAVADQEKERLERKVGQLVVEVDWLKKRSSLGKFVCLVKCQGAK